MISDWNPANPHPPNQPIKAPKDAGAMSANTKACNMDAVIAWVDGNDPEHFKKRSKYLKHATGLSSQASAETRFAHCDEIYYCIASIIKYAPFFEKIWIVTDDQQPARLGEFLSQIGIEPDRVSIIDHRVLFRGYEDCLPTFNSMAISAALWRIPGLANEFVYFNDDVLLCHPISEDQFFRGGKAVIYADLIDGIDHGVVTRLKKLIKSPMRKTNAVTTMARASRTAASILRWDSPIPVPRHHPHPFRRDVIQDFFEKNPKRFRQHIAHRFRHPSQFLPSTLFYALMMRSDIAELREEDLLTYITFSKQMDDLLSALDDLLKGVKPFGCIQSLDLATSFEREHVHQVLDAKFGRILPEA